MRDGVLQQCGEPEKVYANPVNKFVAGFIGTPPMNFVPAKIVAESGRHWVDAGAFKLPLREGHGAAALAGQDVTLGIRPEDILDSELESHVKPTAENTFEAKVEVLEPLGHEYIVYLGTGGHSIIAAIDNQTKVKEGHTHKFTVNLENIHVFDKSEHEVAVR
jgi:multiple sugar transport system ATP-binding protein